MVAHQDGAGEGLLLWIIAKLQDGVPPVSSGAIRKWMEKIPELDTRAFLDNKLSEPELKVGVGNGLNACILKGLKRLCESDPPLVSAGGQLPVGAINYPISYDDLRLTAHGEATLTNLTKAPRRLGFQPTT